MSKLRVFLVRHPCVSNGYVSCVQRRANSHCTVDPRNQSVLLPGPERIRGSKMTPDPMKLMSQTETGLATVPDIVNYAVGIAGNLPCLGTKKGKGYNWITYNEVSDKLKCFGSGLISLGVSSGQQTIIGIYSKTRPEASIATLACSLYSMVVATLYETFGQDALTYIINQTQVPVVICESNKQLKNILIPTHSSVKSVVVMETPTPELQSLAESLGIQVVTFQKVEERGRANLQPPLPPKPNDCFTICYTSGTTGDPKGAMVSHRNVVSCVASVDTCISESRCVEGTIFAYLPSAHIYEIINQLNSLYNRRRIGYYRGDILKIMDDIEILKPSVLPLVPRLMNRLYTTHIQEIRDHPIKKWFLKTAMRKKQEQIKKGIFSSKTIWDRWIFKNFREALGGNVEVVLTTSAPIENHVMSFFRCGAGCQIYEAYGQTECTAATMSVPTEYEGGSVGAPVPSNHMKLVDVPELLYFAKDDVGEICVKGPNVFLGYFKKPEITAECIDPEGWLHTGDVGKWLPNGALKIIDRKKHLFKLAQGEYIAPEKIESVYSQSQQLLQVYVDGLSDKDYVVVIVVPDEDNFKEWTKTKGFTSTDLNELCADKEVRKAVLKKLHKIGEARGLNKLEQARNLYLLPDAMSVDNDLMTPTMKIKRNNARKHFKEVVQNLYDEGELVKLSSKKS